MSDKFYLAFEDRYRGSRELIQSRLEAYLPFIETLKAWHTPCTVFDLGCGRGEWLQLMQINGVQGYGVDIDEHMLEACYKLKLKVENVDALEAIKALPNNSQSVISAFHLVEHIEFAQAQHLVEEAFRVLKPGGLLILETPNAENFTVGSFDFYLDPSHIKPVHSQLLSFMTEFSGFARNKVLRLNESPDIYHIQRPGLIQVLAGVSPDYAVIAQKPAAGDLMEDFDRLFALEYGISFSQIAERYEQGLQNELDEINRRVDGLVQQEQLQQVRTEKLFELTAMLEAQFVEELNGISEQAAQQQNESNNEIAELSNELAEALDQIAILKSQAEEDAEAWEQRLTEELAEQITRLEAQFVEELNGISEQAAQQINVTQANADSWYAQATNAEQQLASAQHRINDLLHSTSWQITAPLRGMHRLIAWLVALPYRSLKAVLRPLLVRVLLFVVRRPALLKRWRSRLSKFPTLIGHLRQFAINNDCIVRPEVVTERLEQGSPLEEIVLSQADTLTEKKQQYPCPHGFNALTPKGKEIFHELNLAIQNNEEYQ